ncbi:hypothetical protein FPV67DRAFT_1528097 [Lyophyllum atratum]|nr:hypothetical protein FPV67DRAFT_1528097 [Lyophyllum atratum]
MFNLKVASLLFLSQVLPSIASGLPRLVQPLIERGEGEGLIVALLRKPNAPRSESGLFGRQAGTCSSGYLPCSDGNGCCPYGKYCGVWGGKLGCCTIGKTCVANNDPCDYEGYLPCANEDFCCPAGDVCARDASGARKCYRSGPGTTLNTPTFTLKTSTPAFTNTFTNTFETDITPTTSSRTTITTTSRIAQSTGSGGDLLPPFSSTDGDVGANGAPATAGAASALLIVAGIAINMLA